MSASVFDDGEGYRSVYDTGIYRQEYIQPAMRWNGTVLEQLWICCQKNTATLSERTWREWRAVPQILSEVPKP